MGQQRDYNHFYESCFPDFFLTLSFFYLQVSLIESESDVNVSNQSQSHYGLLEVNESAAEGHSKDIQRHQSKSGNGIPL